MDASVNNYQSAITQKSNGILAAVLDFGFILSLLIGFIQLTEEEQREVGVYLGK